MPQRTSDPHALPSSSFQSFLGVLIVVLVVAYHYVTADPKFEAQKSQ